MIRRAEHSAENRFFLLTRKTAQDKRLSFQARGLLAYVLSKPPKWEAKDIDIMKQGGIGKHAFASILKELKAAGYVRRVESRARGGTFNYSLEISEEPCFTPESPVSDNRVAAERVADYPQTESQIAHNNSTCERATTVSIDQRELKKRQEKPRRAELYALPPDSMLELTDEDREWLHRNAPHVPDYARAVQKWSLKQQTNGGKSKTIEQWRASWQAYMMNYSDGEATRNGNGRFQKTTSSGNGGSEPIAGIDHSLPGRIKRAW